MTENLPSWSTTISRQIYQLIALLMVFVAIVLTNFFWKENSSNRAKTIANGYHLTSSFYFLDALSELQTVEHGIFETQIRNEQLLNKQFSKYLPISGSLFIIRNKIDSAFELHQTFKNKQFESLVKKSQINFLNFETSVNNYLSNQQDSNNIIQNIDSLTVSLQQLVSLHTILRKQVLEKQQQTKYEDNLFLLLTTIIVLISGIFIFRRSLITIKSILYDNKKVLLRSQQSQKMEAIGQLAGGIAHDFNNINAGLFGNIELAKMKLDPDHAAYSNIQAAYKALTRASSLTKRLLTFAKGGDPLLETFNINQVLQSAIEFALSGSNIRLALTLPDDLWQIKADKDQLFLAITNLTTNANQAMVEGGKLYIKAKNIKEIDKSIAPNLSGDFVKLCIRDEGSGISTEDLGNIFDPYFTTKEFGRGLGLATVHSIITKHGGHVSVDSELGVGTTFTIYLPADSSLSKIIKTTASEMTETPRTMPGHILLMDDDEMILNLSMEIIETFGYTVDTAVDGKEAIEKYISAEKCGKAFDVVIMDLTIPGGMGGKETLKELLAFDPEAKVIVSSGYSNDPAIACYSEYGFKGKLVKPFQMDELQKELSLHIVQN